jgi:ubiquinone/menaquinone biosynthesis C-methylase UbiE
MNNQKSDNSGLADSWDTYWQGTGDIGAYSSGGDTHPDILGFWDQFFETMKQVYSAPRIIDIASGNGMVIERALVTYGDEQPDLTCLDISETAITNIRDRFPQVRGVVTDALNIPLDSGSFDIATSQFGVEYAGLDAINEVARLLKENGQLAFLMHNQASSIHKECVESLDAIGQLMESGFVPHAIEMFKAGFEAVRGVDRTPYEVAAKKLAPAIGSLERIMRQYGQHVAGDTIARLYNDVDQIHQRIQHYDPEEVLAWLNSINGELDAYSGRMASMSNAAIDSETFDQIVENLRGQGFEIEGAEPLVIPGHETPLAWILIAKKQTLIFESDV